MAEGVGNERANYFWEGNKPASAQKIVFTSSQTDRKNFIREKYVKKTWARTDIADPYTAVMKGTIEAQYGTIKKVEQVKPESQPTPDNKVLV